jgi:hypothetical protein
MIRYPVPRRGVGHRHERWDGMRWTRQCPRTVLSQGGPMRPVSDQGVRRRTALLRTAKSCGPDASTPASSLRWRCEPDRADHTFNPQATVTRKPDRRGEREISRKTIRVRGCRVISVDLYYSCASYFYLCTRGGGCTVRPAFPTPSWGGGSCKTRTHCAARSRRRIWPSLRGAKATKQSRFLSLGGKAGLLRFARNDGRGRLFET